MHKLVEFPQSISARLPNDEATIGTSRRRGRRRQRNSAPRRRECGFRGVVNELDRHGRLTRRHGIDRNTVLGGIDPRSTLKLLFGSDFFIEGTHHRRRTWIQRPIGRQFFIPKARRREKTERSRGRDRFFHRRLRFFHRRFRFFHRRFRFFHRRFRFFHRRLQFFHRRRTRAAR